MRTLKPRIKILLTFILPAVLAAIIIVLFLNYKLLNSAIERWGPENKFLIHTLEKHLENNIDASVRALVSTSRQPAFSSLTYLDQIDSKINGIPENLDTEKRQILETLRTDFGSFSVLFVLNAKGDHYISHPYSVQKNLKKFNLSQRPYFKKATATKKTVVSDSFIGADGIPAVAIDVPILNKNNEIIAHLGGVFHLEKLSKLVDKKVISPFDHGFIVDAKDNLIAHTDRSLVNNNDRKSYLNNELLKASSGMKKEYAIKRYIDPQTQSKYLAAVSELENGWKLFLLREEKSILEASEAQVYQTTIVILIMLGATSMIGFFFAAHTTKKWEAAEENLIQAHRSLESKVKERTNELLANELKFKRLFENADVAILNEDLSGLYSTLVGLRAQGVEDLRQYLMENERAAWEMASQIKVLQVNQAALKLFDAPSQNEMITGIDKTFGANAFDVFLNELCAIWENKKVFRSEANFKSLNGKEINAIITFQIPSYKDGFESIPVSILDITKLKKAELEEQIATENLKNILNSATLFSIIATDRKGLITNFNPGAENMLGYTAQEMVGKETPAKFHLESEVIDKSKVLSETYGYKVEGFDAIVKIASENDYEECEWTYVHKSGRYISTKLGITAVKNKAGEFVGFLGIASDITQVKETEKELAEHRDHLQDLVNEQTQEIRSAMEAADEANHAKSAFLSSMSHELRTPLNAILGFAQLLELNKKEQLSDGQKSHVSQIMDGGKHLLELIDEVLDLAKIEAGKVTYLIEEFSTRKLIDECLSFATIIATKHHIIIQNNLSPILPDLWADRLRCKQVILNLISNAIKYNTAGGSIVIDGEERPDGHFRIFIKDTGVGIADDKKELLFQPFQRLGAEFSGIDGTGIGLLLTKKFIEEMNGSIGFESTLGIGSTFWVDFPIAKERKSSQETEVESFDTFNVDKPINESLLLYIEDNPSSVVLMEGIVENIDGLEMISAHTAELGIELADERQPDVILLDINLPGMNGIDAIKKLKKMDSTSSIPAIALSANALPEDFERGLKAGFDKYLSKPLNVSELLSVLNDTIKGVDAAPNSWSEKLHVGIKAIDEDHQVLFSLLDRLTKKLVEPHVVKDVSNELLSYTKYHFDREEKIMRSCEYPDLKNHQNIHKELILKMNELVGNWKENPSSETLFHFQSFLRHWLVDHIMTEDKKIFLYNESEENL